MRSVFLGALALSLRAAAVKSPPAFGNVNLKTAGKHKVVSAEQQELGFDGDAFAWSPLEHWSYSEDSSIRQHRRHRSFSEYPMRWQTLQWIHNQTQWIDLSLHAQPPLPSNFKTDFAFFTHAGKNGREYVDGAVMLGRSLAKHVPQYPRFAITIQGMKDTYRQQLMNAGWHVVTVEDWGADHCGENCASRFLGRWGDSFEKLNIFRLPFKQAIFLDADTYVFSDELKKIVTDTGLEGGQIAMTRDGCKAANDSTEFNSGMILLQPDLTEFARMLELIAIHSKGDAALIGDVLDQGIINEEYKGRVVELQSKFNCIDISNSKRCPMKCLNDMVVAHFTGMPKLTRAATGWIGLVKNTTRKNANETCGTTLHGVCYRFADYYCGMVDNKKYLSPELQESVAANGKCQRQPTPPRPPHRWCPSCKFKEHGVRMPYDRIPVGSGAAGAAGLATGDRQVVYTLPGQGRPW